MTKHCLGMYGSFRYMLSSETKTKEKSRNKIVKIYANYDHITDTIIIYFVNLDELLNLEWI